MPSSFAESLGCDNNHSRRRGGGKQQVVPRCRPMAGHTGGTDPSDQPTPSHIAPMFRVGWVSCCWGQAVNPVVDVLFPPTHRPGVFTAETDRRRERPVPFPTPDRGPAQPRDLHNLGHSHHPPTPRRLCPRAPIVDTLPTVVGLVSHPLPLFPLIADSPVMVRYLARPSDADGQGCVVIQRTGRDPQPGRASTLSRSRIHALRSRIQPFAVAYPVAHPSDLGFRGRRNTTAAAAGRPGAQQPAGRAGPHGRVGYLSGT